MKSKAELKDFPFKNLLIIAREMKFNFFTFFPLLSLSLPLTLPARVRRALNETIEFLFFKFISMLSQLAAPR